MTATTESAVEVDLTEPEPPFPGAASFPITKPVNLAQLEGELTAATSDAISLALTGAPAPDQPFSDANTATLWLLPPTIDQATVTQVITNHVADSQWGVPTVTQEFNAVWGKLTANPEASLTSAEQTHLLVGLAFRVMAGPQVGPV